MINTMLKLNTGFDLENITPRKHLSGDFHFQTLKFGYIDNSGSIFTLHLLI